MRAFEDLLKFSVITGKGMIAKGRLLPTFLCQLPNDEIAVLAAPWTTPESKADTLQFLGLFCSWKHVVAFSFLIEAHMILADEGIEKLLPEQVMKSMTSTVMLISCHSLVSEARLSVVGEIGEDELGDRTVTTIMPLPGGGPTVGDLEEIVERGKTPLSPEEAAEFGRMFAKVATKV